MKKLLFAFCFTCFCFSAFAVTSKKSDWNKIRTDRSLRVIQPELSKHFGPQGIFNMCSTDNEFRSIHPISTCVEYKKVKGSLNKEYSDPREGICTKKELRDIYMSRHVSKTVCINRGEQIENESSECLEWADETITYPTKYSIAVAQAQTPESDNVVFKKDYEIPDCDETVQE